MTISEKSFQSKVIANMEARRWKVHFNNNTRTSRPAGYPDLTAWHTGHKRLIFVELKTEIGQLSEPQKTVCADLGSIGQDVYLWRPQQWNEILAILDNKSFDEIEEAKVLDRLDRYSEINLELPEKPLSFEEKIALAAHKYADAKKTSR
jgi:hypothetical protein